MKIECENNIERNNIERNNIERNNIERNNIERNNIERNNIERNNIQRNNIERNNIERNNIERNGQSEEPACRTGECRIIVGENASGFDCSWINTIKSEIRVMIHKLSVLMSPRYYKNQSVNAV